MAAKKKPKLEKSPLEDASELMAEQGFLNKYDLKAGERCVATGRFVGRRGVMSGTTTGLSVLYVADDGDDEARPISSDEGAYGTPSISPDGRHAIANIGGSSPGVLEFEIEEGTSTRIWEGMAPNGNAITQVVYCGEGHVAIFAGAQLDLMRRSGPGAMLEHASTLGTAEKGLKGLTMKRAHEGRALVLVHQTRSTLIGLTGQGELEVLADMPIKKGSFATLNDRVVQRDAASGEVYEITNLDELLSF